MVRDFSLVSPSFGNGHISCTKQNHGLQDYRTLLQNCYSEDVHM